MTPDRPPRGLVAMACDAGYLPYALTLAAGIDAAHPGRRFDLGLLSEAPLVVPPSLAHLRLRTWTLPGGNPFRNGREEGRHGAAAYLRLLLPDLVAGDYDRLLYLDADILCLGGGLERLLAADMGGRWLAAVRDNTQWRTPGRRLPEQRAAGRPARPYLNSGVLMVDLAAWAREGIEARALDLHRAQAHLLTRHDQSILNLLADGGWAEMSPVWNWQYTWSSRYFADLAEPRLLHFIGPRKPWADAGADLPARHRRAYADFLARHFPGVPCADPGPMAWPGGLRRSLLKHWAAAPAMGRYLARFPDPYALVPAT